MVGIRPPAVPAATDVPPPTRGEWNLLGKSESTLTLSRTGRLAPWSTDGNFSIRVVIVNCGVFRILEKFETTMS